MATVSIGDWDEKNTASVTDPGSTPTGIQKVQPVKVTWNNGSSSSGTGVACEFTTSNVSDATDLVVTESDESTTRAYEIAFFDSANNVAWLWVYGSWDRNGTDQIVIGAGTGDGTNYSSPSNAAANNNNVNDGTGSNPWSQTGVNATRVYHLNEESGAIFDSVSGSTDENSHTGTTYAVSGQFGAARSFDASDDFIDPADSSDFNYDTGMLVLWYNPDTLPSNMSNYDFGGMWDQSSDTNLLTYFNKSNSEVTYGWDGNNNTERFGVAESNISTGTWFRSILDYDGSTFEGWLDNTEEITQNFSDTSGGQSDVNIGGQDDGSNIFPGDIDGIRFYAGTTKDDDWKTADWDASPKGGQDFFSWGGAQSTSTNANATITSISASPLTANTSGTADAQADITSATATVVTAATSATADALADITSATASVLTAATSSTADADAAATSVTFTPLTTGSSVTTNADADITSATGTPLVATASLPGTQADATITSASATTFTAATSSTADADAVITTGSVSPLQAATSTTTSADATITSFTASPLTANGEAVINAEADITSANTSPLQAAAESVIDAAATITSISATILQTGAEAVADADATITVAKTAAQDAGTKAKNFPRNVTRTIDIKKNQTETLDGDVVGNE